MKKLSIKLLILILLTSIVFSFLQIFFVKSEVNAAGLSSSYTQYIKSGISAFPESYQKKLAYLKYFSLKSCQPWVMYQEGRCPISWRCLRSALSCSNICTFSSLIPDCLKDIFYLFSKCKLVTIPVTAILDLGASKEIRDLYRIQLVIKPARNEPRFLIKHRRHF